MSYISWLTTHLRVSPTAFHQEREGICEGDLFLTTAGKLYVT